MITSLIRALAFSYAITSGKRQLALNELAKITRTTTRRLGASWTLESARDIVMVNYVPDAMLDILRFEISTEVSKHISESNQSPS